MVILKAAWLLTFIVAANADIYMHNPRGSNDRNCERNANRNNGNRLFDSQNNAAGGYACPRAVGDDDIQDEAGNTLVGQNKKIYYYEGKSRTSDFSAKRVKDLRLCRKYPSH